MDFAHQIEKEMANSIPPWVHFHGVEVLPKISDLVLVSSFFRLNHKSCGIFSATGFLT
jgi:hypothetical protein